MTHRKSSLRKKLLIAAAVLLAVLAVLAVLPGVFFGYMSDYDPAQDVAAIHAFLQARQGA